MSPKSREYSVIDPVQKDLDKSIVSNGKVLPEVRDKIIKAVEYISSKIKQDISNIWVMGSSLTHQWKPDSDIDVTLFLTQKKTRAELKEINKLMNKYFNGKLFVGNHPINFHVSPNRYYKFNADSIYDLLKDNWIKKPKALNESDIQEIISKCSSSEEFNEILEEYKKLTILLESYNGSNTEDVITQALKVSYLFNKIKDIRREDFNKKKDSDIPSANFRCSNIIFKLLESYGLDSLAVQISSIFDSRLKN